VDKWGLLLTKNLECAIIYMFFDRGLARFQRAV